MATKFQKMNLCYNNHLPPNFDGLPYPHPRWYTPIVFHQDEGKRCKIDYLKARGQLLFRSYAALKKIEGVATTPPPG